MLESMSARATMLTPFTLLVSEVSWVPLPPAPMAATLTVEAVFWARRMAGARPVAATVAALPLRKKRRVNRLGMPGVLDMGDPLEKSVELLAAPGRGGWPLG